MEKISFLFVLCLCCFLAVSCSNEFSATYSVNSNNTINSDISLSNDSSEYVSIDNSTSDLASNSDEVLSSDISSIKEYNLVNIVKLSTLELSVNENYHIVSMMYDDYTAKELTYDFSDSSIASYVDGGYIKGLKIGECELTIVDNETDCQKVIIKVCSDEYMYSHFTIDKGRLYQKRAIFYGDSITDSSVTAYPDNKPYFYPERIRDICGLYKLYNRAKSGATAGISFAISFAGQIYGTYQVNSNRPYNKVSDYAFIMFGTNDFSCKVNVGTINDTLSSFGEKESFYGAYDFMFKTLKEHNPRIRIVTISIPVSSWGQRTEYNPSASTIVAESRAELTQCIENITNKYGYKMVNVSDLWTMSNLSSYCPDGIHPNNAGYELIVKRILGEI